jgi:16S rRNA (guanine1207-N2)-methyltransferase
MLASLLALAGRKPRGFRRSHDGNGSAPAATMRAMHDHAARDVLLLAFETGALAWPTDGVVWFANARALPDLSATKRAQVRAEQSFKPDAEALRAAGYTLAEGGEQDLPLALVLPARQRDFARAQLAQAWRRLAPGGVLVASQANNEGARSLQADMQALCGDVVALSKKHCRTVWATATPERIDAALAHDWAALDAPRALADGWVSRPGVFAWDRTDVASSLLIEHLPRGLPGRAADLGAGTGVLAAALLERNPQLSALDLFEADARALELARTNLAARAGATALGFHWHDVTSGLPARFDAIVMNPPFHLGRADLPELGRAFIAAAAAALAPGGQLWLVANRHLPYEAALAQVFATVREVAVAHGFKVITARKDTRA